jgi:hypothetical protein
MQLSLSSDWVAPIEVPGYGIIFPQRGISEIPEGAIDYLLVLGYVISTEPKVAESKPEIKRAKPKIVTPPNPE